MQLTAEDSRVLGCLIEKQLATPHQYPLTENAVVLACNQTTNRDPVVSYDQTIVRRALMSLREQGLARLVHRPGDRAPKHRHLLEEALDLEEPQLALLSVLLLRGPQTAAELRTRTERLHAFEDVTEVEQVLLTLSERSGQLVQRLERQPGQKEDRYLQLLGVHPEHGVVLGADPGEASVVLGDAEMSGPTLAELAVVVRQLQDEVRQLRAEVAELRSSPITH